ncbi:hypothetical protein EYF80_048130 [Liparis tanakae]|uniref:Uncharacterized protein n=1 Tax=Liparis tanakae TaxID=230148 RepID=A0A4Z2FKC0_9TELE|nr:hypothetical protein EYF80_048130 [Liparis tanakae]
MNIVLAVDFGRGPSDLLRTEASETKPERLVNQQQIKFSHVKKNFKAEAQWLESVSRANKADDWLLELWLQWKGFRAGRLRPAEHNEVTLTGRRENTNTDPSETLNPSTKQRVMPRGACASRFVQHFSATR